MQGSADLPSIPKPTATTGGYARYLRELHDYWRDFIQKTQPLMPLDDLLKKATAAFDERWAKGEVARWQAASAAAGGDGGAVVETGPISLEGVGSAVELEAHVRNSLFSSRVLVDVFLPRRKEPLHIFLYIYLRIRMRRLGPSLWRAWAARSS